MVGGYQIIDLNKYVGKKITQEQLNTILGYGSDQKKPIMYKVTNQYNLVYRAYNVVIAVNGDDYILYLQVMLNTSGQLNNIFQASQVLVNFLHQSDSTYLVSIGEL